MSRNSEAYAFKLLGLHSERFIFFLT